jgi:hypothetical protein
VRRFIIGLGLCLSAFAESRHFDVPCAAVFPSAAQVMISAGFQPQVSDATGGLLTLQFSGEPMVYHFRVKHVNPFLDKYVADGEKLHNKVRGLTFTGATFGFRKEEAGGCTVQLSVALSTVDQSANIPRRPGEPAWVRVLKPVPSNGTAEREFLDQIQEAK